MTLAIGIGCRKGCDSATIEALARRAAASIGREIDAAGLFTHAAKMGEAGLIEAARNLGLPLVFLPPALLSAAAGRAQTRSAKVEALFDLPSIAETAALAGAGAGARLVVARISAAGASCAIAESGR